MRTHSPPPSARTVVSQLLAVICRPQVTTPMKAHFRLQRHHPTRMRTNSPPYSARTVVSQLLTVVCRPRFPLQRCTVTGSILTVKGLQASLAVVPKHRSSSPCRISALRKTAHKTQVCLRLAALREKTGQRKRRRNGSVLVGCTPRRRAPQPTAQSQQRHRGPRPIQPQTGAASMQDRLRQI